ncbi:hypothetical protein OROHE_005721 [Orobanche hederae]
MDYDNIETLLPQEILEEEILSRLAVKSLLRFRCVSKSWRSLIESDRFIKNHYRKSTMNTSLAHHRVIFNWRRFGETKQYSLQSMLDQERTHPYPFDEETDNKTITGDASVIGYCNGVFCLVNIFRRYFLWNPGTKTFFKLPKIPPTDLLPCLWLKRGFGWDETTCAYKVFALSSDADLNNKRVARVYSSKMNSWAIVDHGTLFVHNGVGFYARGNLHWVTKSGDRIECFDLKSETFGEIEMPSGGRGDGLDSLRLGEVKGCLSMVRELEGGGLDVWVMKEHGVKESWQKLIHYNWRQQCLSLPCGEVLVISGRNFFPVSGGVVKHKEVSGV